MKGVYIKVPKGRKHEEFHAAAWNFLNGLSKGIKKPGTRHRFYEKDARHHSDIVDTIAMAPNGIICLYTTDATVVKKGYNETLMGNID